MGKRVLQVIGPSTGGIRRHVRFLTDHLRRSGWSVDIAGPEGVLEDVEHEIRVPGGLDIATAVRTRGVLARLMDGYDIIHAHGLKVGWLASLVRNRPPLVLSVHNLVLDEAAGRTAPILRHLEGRLPGRVDATVAISDEVAARFEGAAGADRIVVVPPAGPVPQPTRAVAEVRADLGVVPGEDLVVTAARLHPQKDLDLLLDVAARVRQEREGLRWFVFGDGPLRTSLERRCRHLGLSDVVHFAGQRASLDDELNAADVVAVTSRWESGPLVVLEALALRRPVLSTAVGLAPDVVPASGGVVVPVGDAPSFAAALEGLLERADRSVVAPASDLHPEALAERVAAVYSDVLVAS